VVVTYGDLGRGPGQRRFLGELRARERDRRWGPSLEQARFRELVAGRGGASRVVGIGGAPDHPQARVAYVTTEVVGSVSGDMPAGEEGERRARALPPLVSSWVISSGGAVTPGRSWSRPEGELSCSSTLTRCRPWPHPHHRHRPQRLVRGCRSVSTPRTITWPCAASMGTGLPPLRGSWWPRRCPAWRR